MFLKQNELEKLTEEFLWLKQEIFNSESVITKADFPCVFGVQGYKRQLHYVSALNYPYDSKELSNDIEKYLKELDSLDSKESGLSGLLVYFQPLGNMSIKAKQFLSWRVLSEMKKNLVALMIILTVILNKIIILLNSKMNCGLLILVQIVTYIEILET